MQYPTSLPTRLFNVKSALLVAVGLLLMYSGLILTRLLDWQSIGSATGAASIIEIAPETLVRLRFAPESDQPYLLTAGGTILRPTEQSRWQLITFERPVRDLYFDTQLCAVVATDGGVYQYDGAWQPVLDASGGSEIVAMHGYTFVLGGSDLPRSGHETWQRLDVPEATQPTSGFAMLGNHNHVLLNGGLYITPDMGLSWQPLPAPETASRIAADADGDLLAATANGLLRWNRRTTEWRTLAALPDDAPVEALHVFSGQIYALANGGLFILDGEAWTRVDVEGTFTALDVRREHLWLLDGTNRVLWSSRDGQQWTPQTITIDDAPTDELRECS